MLEEAFLPGQFLDGGTGVVLANVEAELARIRVGSVSSGWDQPMSAAEMFLLLLGKSKVPSSPGR